MIDQFITTRAADADGILQYYIVSRTFPFYVGRVTIQYETKPLCLANIPKHKMWVAFDGDFEGKRIFMHQNSLETISETMKSMATWYYQERILQNPGRYAKWAWEIA